MPRHSKHALRRKAPALLTCAFLAVATGRADVQLPSVISEHAVLQKNERTAIWGTAAPGERVTVTLSAKSGTATADASGRWTVTLDLSEAPPGPHELVVKGKNELRVADILVGEVWLASGQSNMEWLLRETSDAAAAIERAENPQLRIFTVKKAGSPAPATDAAGEWRVASPKVAPYWTAVGYHFANTLQRQLKRPVGLLHASWGGTPIEAWTSEPALLEEREIGPRVKQVLEDARRFPETIAAFAKLYSAWAETYRRMDTHTQATEAIIGDPAPGGNWLPYDPAGERPADDWPEAGTVWLRHRVPIPAALIGISQPLYLGRIDGFYTVYWRGKKLIEVTPATGAPPPGPVYIPTELMGAGEATLAIRIHHGATSPRLLHSAATPIRFGGRDLASGWSALVTAPLPKATPEMLSAMPATPSQPLGISQRPAYLFNAMIAPLSALTLRGAIWYQGESNSGRSHQYRTLFPMMIRDWRQQWGLGDFPFYYVQLANFGAKDSAPTPGNGWSELREAQALALALPRTGQAVAIDVGEELDVHPRNKREVGQRLALIALAKTYGERFAYSGPAYAGIDIEGARIRVSFTQTHGGLVAKKLPAVYKPRSTGADERPLVTYNRASDLEGFAICGTDRKWVWAQARIENDTVVAWADDVPRPVAVRYGWQMNPTVNLYNGAGLPAAPFRSDDFQPTTRDARY